VERYSLVTASPPERDVLAGEVTTMNKTSAIADWALPLLLWIAVVGIFVSLVVAALSNANG
jgi:hypothetical protein